MLYVDSRTLTFSVTVSVLLVAIVAGLVRSYLARRKSDTYSSSDTS